MDNHADGRVTSPLGGIFKSLERTNEQRLEDQFIEPIGIRVLILATREVTDDTVVHKLDVNTVVILGGYSERMTVLKGDVTISTEPKVNHDHLILGIFESLDKFSSLVRGYVLVGVELTIIDHSETVAVIVDDTGTVDLVMVDVDVWSTSNNNTHELRFLVQRAE
jgi:hypothetical protein